MERPPTERYTHSHAPVVVAAHSRRTAEESAAFVLPHLEAGMDLLDVGCGPGTITVGLAARVAPGAVIGIDAVEAILATARDNATAAGVTNLSFASASAYGLPFPEASYDVAYAHQVLQHLADPVAALGEMRRVVRPGGLVAVRDADYGTMTHHPPEPLLDRWLTVYHAMARGNGGEPDAGRRLLQWVQAAGLIDPVVTSSVWTFATADERRHWARLWADRMLVPGFAERAEELGVSDTEELRQIGAAFLRWADHPDGWFAFINGEVLARTPG